MNTKKLLFVGALVCAMAPFSGAQAWIQDTVKRTITVKPGATIAIAGSGNESRQCELWAHPTFAVQKAAQLGKLTSKEMVLTIKEGSPYSAGCVGNKRNMTYVWYTAGKTKGTDKVEFSLTNPMTTFVYEITVEVK